MVVDIRHHRHFVCRRGQVLRELAEEYGGVAVSFPRTGTNSQRVTLKGAKDCVEAAKKRIQEIIEDLVRDKCEVKAYRLKFISLHVCLCSGYWDFELRKIVGKRNNYRTVGKL